MGQEGGWCMTEDLQAILKEQKAYEWNHSIDEMISSVLQAGLLLTSFYEYEFT